MCVYVSVCRYMLFYGADLEVTLALTLSYLYISLYIYILSYIYVIMFVYIYICFLRELSARNINLCLNTCRPCRCCVSIIYFMVNCSLCVVLFAELFRLFIFSCYVRPPLWRVEELTRRQVLFYFFCRNKSDDV